MRLAKPFPFASSGVDTCASAGRQVCVGLWVSAALAVGVARASTQPLPPLPPEMQLDRAVTPLDVSYDVPPLPGDASAAVPNPFRQDAAGDADASRASAAAGDSHADAPSSDARAADDDNQSRCEGYFRVSL